MFYRCLAAMLLSPQLHALLPKSFCEQGSLVEWLSSAPGEGAGALAAALCQPAKEDRWCVIDGQREFYPAAFVANGWPTPVVIRPSSVKDSYWAIEQCLRSPAVSLLWCQQERVPPVVYRRWKLAAEAGGGMAMLFRPATSRSQSSWADLRWLVTPVPGTATSRRWRLELLYCRQGLADMTLIWEQEHATGAVRVVSELADSTSLSRPSRLARTAAGAGG